MGMLLFLVKNLNLSLVTGVFKGVCKTHLTINPVPNDKFRLFEIQRVCRRQFQM